LTTEPNATIFTVLVPHRDYARLIRLYRKELFAAGFAGAYSFPVAAPLAMTDRPFTRDELKEIASNLRALSFSNNKDGKIATGKPRIISCPDISLSLLGLELDIPAPLFPENALYTFPSLILTTAVISPTESTILEKKEKLPQPPEFSFRAAMVANMIFRPLNQGAKDYSFEWKTGEAIWLPKH
jgi:hypothetical protein